uniref:Uncharacterized protein n=1 Tax=Oryza punctata TaxID=4537 RepID=A0A0E0JLA3_ORYPU
MSGTRFPDEPTISKRRGNKKRKKNAKTTHIDEEDIASGDDTDIDSDGSRSPEYVESGDSSSASEKIPDDEDDNVAAKNQTSNDAQAKNSKGAVVRPARRSKRRLKNINTLIDIDKGNIMVLSFKEVKAKSHTRLAATNKSATAAICSLKILLTILTNYSYL